MIARLLQLSLRFRWVVLGLAAALIFVGVQRAGSMPADVFPDLSAPRVTVVTEASGLAAEEIERLVTYPIESATNGSAGVRRVRSATAPGISVVWVEFDWKTSQPIARQRVAERLQSAIPMLPPEASAPLIAPTASVMGEIAFVALTSDELSPLELRRIADVEVVRRLMAVEGISQVVPIGGEVKQYQVLLDALALERYELTSQHVVETLQRGNTDAAGGYVTSGGQESVVRVLGRAHTAEDIANLVIETREGVPVRVGDVADVGVGPAVTRGTASYNATPAVMLSVIRQPTADTLSTTTRLDAALDDLEADLAPHGVEVHRDVFRQKDFIDRAVHNVKTVLRDGAILVVIVLFVFLWSVRPTLISVVAIPLSLLAAILVLDLAGFRIDTMTLGGLAIAVGELVDDAIVDVENVARRLRERARRPPSERQPTMLTVFTASLEIRSAIVSATYVLMLVFLPLLLLDGLEGRLLRPLAVAYLVAIFASLVVAVTVTPVLCSMLLPRPSARTEPREPPVSRFCQRAYAPILRTSMRRPGVVAGGAALLAALGLIALLGMGRSFLPDFNEGNLTINMVLTPGTPLEESDALGRLAERALMEDPAVLAVGRRTGRAERDEHVLGVETSEIEVRLDPKDSRSKERIFSDVRERLRVVSSAQFTLGQPISHRIDHMVSGQRAALSIKIFGEDMPRMRRIAERIVEAGEGVKGLVDLTIEPIVDIPQLVIDVDPQAASNYGLSRGEAATVIGTALWGRTPTHVYEEGLSADVVVKYPPAMADNIDSLREIRIATPTGAVVPITALADIRKDKGPNVILREGVKRRLVVTANVSDRDLRGVYEELRERISATVELPEGYRVAYAGQFEREATTGRKLLLLGAFVIIGIGVIVATTLHSLRRCLIVLVNLPMALAGGVIGVHLAGGVLSVATTIGFITLFGISTRSGILLATRTRDLEIAGRDRETAVAVAAQERLIPILMTALTAAFGLLPLALALGEPGSEIQAPMALVILTGLLSSTALNMIAVPALLNRWGGETQSSVDPSDSSDVPPSASSSG